LRRVSDIMRTTLLTAILAAAPIGATQIVYMDLGEVLPMTGSVLIAEVISMDTEEGDGWDSAIYCLNILDMLRGSADTGVEISCSYHLNLPRSYESAMGTVTWVSPLETGSGYEFFVSSGDVVIVLLESDYADAAGSHTLLRIEPLDMLEQLMGEMDIASLGGGGYNQVNQDLIPGESYTHGFVYSGERWRSMNPPDVPPGTTVSWEWMNGEDWQDVLSMTSDTLLITFEIVDVREIEYRCILPDTPERWKRVYASRILEVSIL